MTRQCSICKQHKPIEEFPFRSSGKSDKRVGYCRVCRGGYRRGLYQKHKASGNRRVRNYHLKRKYGITLSQFEEMARQQKDRCGICRRKCLHTGEKNDYRVFCVDHDHETGRVRALLCGSCNIAIGLLGERNLRRALRYVVRHSIKVIPPES